MSQQTINQSPGYYDREIDLSQKVVAPTGTPYAIVGSSTKGRAFTPMTVGSYSDLVALFGEANQKNPSLFAAKEVLQNGRAVTFTRVLGAGASQNSTEIEATRTAGIVKNAGMKVIGSVVGNGDNRHKGHVQFLAAKHIVSSSEAVGFPMFSDNSSFALPSDAARLVRAALFTAYDSRFMVMDTNETFAPSIDDAATIDNTPANPTYRNFKLVLSTSAGSTFAKTDGFAGIKIFTASFNPSDNSYIGKILNTDPTRFEAEKHLLYLDFAVDAELASVASGSGNNGSVMILSGSDLQSANSGLIIGMREAFGRFDTRFTTAKTPSFISQPFGSTEHDLFSVEALDDGFAGSGKFKISIGSLKLSSDPKNPFGTFSLIVRDINDTDFDQKILEQFNGLSINPESENYIAKVIGDKKVFYNFDVENEDDKRLIQVGQFGNKSKFIRISVSDAVKRKNVPPQSLPFGFRGVPVINTNSSLTDTGNVALSARLAGSGSASVVSSSIVPPLPFRFKITRGAVSDSPTFSGDPGSSEIVDHRLFWGVKFERNTNVTNPNIVSLPNPIVEAYSKFQGIEKLDVLVSGSFCDQFNNNKFTLAKISFDPAYSSVGDLLNVSSETVMKGAAYIRNGTPESQNYTVLDGSSTRVTLASVVNFKNYSDTDVISLFNKFADFTKFTTLMYGGWDGTNIFETNQLNDVATSTESSATRNGGASNSYTSPGATINYSGISNANASVQSFKTAADIATDPRITNANVFAFPGIREPLVVDYVADLVKNKNQLAFFVSEAPAYDDNATRIFDSETTTIDAENTAFTFTARNIDNDATGFYFPNVVMEDSNRKRVTLPASVPALTALSYTDKVSYPWWAPAGLNRASLDSVKLTQVRLNQPDQNLLNEARINPIIKLPGEGYVIFSQRTAKLGRSALETINVKRMVLEVKSMVVAAAQNIVFENITQDLYDLLNSNIKSLMASVQVKQGIERFNVVCDGTNNTENDVNANRINGRIEFKPTRSVEFIFIDFFVTPSGVSFGS